MADITLSKGELVPVATLTKMVDMGDGTHAPEVSTVLDTGTASIGTVGLDAGTNNIGDVDVATIAAGGIALPPVIYNGVSTVAAPATAEILAAAQVIQSGVRIKALIANTGDVYVGDAAVAAANGYVLDAGEEVFIEIANLATVYLDVSVGGEGVSYVAS